MEDKARFIVIYDEPHQILGKLTSETPLIDSSYHQFLDLSYQLKGLAEKLPDEYFFMFLDDSRNPLDLSSDDKLMLAASRDYFDATRIDSRCYSFKRMRTTQRGSTLLSLDALCFGVGALRRKCDSPKNKMHRWIRERGIIKPRGINIDEIPSINYDPFERKEISETWESTNLICGDVFGELKQIQERKDDAIFMRVLLGMFNRVISSRISGYYFNQTDPLPDELIDRHLKQGVWMSPPSSVPKINDRVQFIMDNSFVNTSPYTYYETPVITSEPSDYSTSSSNSSAGIEIEPLNPDDRSGYDGWLNFS